ncbi:MAG TPA: methyltransferase domain-containing protein [Kofleriaceae bacterium]|jgi:ubiquinone/menaquinone biosynthesis C-methylase UbiE
MDQQTMDAMWNRIAPAYDDYVTPCHLPVGHEACVRAGVGPGTRFLDVACGSGGLSLPAARLGASVTAIDIAPAMVERLKSRARAGGVEIDARAMDGHRLEFPDDSVDVAGSQFGVMLFPDLPRGLAEMVRVTRPGGVVVVAALGPPMQIEFFSFFIRAMKMVVPGFQGPPMDPPPHAFQISDAAVFRQRMEEAGLKDIAIDTVTERIEIRSGKHLWDWVLGSNPLATAMTSGLTAAQVPAVQAALEEAIRDRAGSREIAVLTNPVHIGVGVV